MCRIMQRLTNQSFVQPMSKASLRFEFMVMADCKLDLKLKYNYDVSYN